MHGRPLARTSIAVLAAMAAAGLAACAAAQPTESTSSFLVGRGQYRLYSCVQLATLVRNNEKRQRELLALIDKAKQGPGGGFVSALTYEPDLAVARGQLAEMRRVQAERKCPATEPAEPSLPSPRRRR